jgi:hypothetical protein
MAVTVYVICTIETMFGMTNVACHFPSARLTKKNLDVPLNNVLRVTSACKPKENILSAFLSVMIRK